MIRGYYFITDSSLTRKDNISDVKSAVKAGCAIVQYREEPKNTGSLCKEAEKLKRLCLGAVFMVNNYVDVALAVDSDGVHLGQGDFSVKSARRLLGGKKIIGVTVHNVREAKAAVDAGADYLAVSPIFSTSTKKDAGRPAGAGLIKRVKLISPVPVIAIGGITLSNAVSVISAGADGLCAISDVLKSRSVYNRVKDYQRLFDRLVKNKWAKNKGGEK